jgi:hypothetical protein
VLSGAVDGVANRLLDALSIEIQPALGALALEFAPGRHGEPLEERIGLSDTVIQPPTVVQLMSGYLDNRLFKILIICKVDRFFPGPVQELLECLEFMFLGSRVIIKFIKHDHSA